MKLIAVFLASGLMVVSASSLAAQNSSIRMPEGAVGCQDREDFVTFIRQTAESAGDPSETLAQALVLQVLKRKRRCRSFDYRTAITVHRTDSMRILGKVVPILLVSEGKLSRQWWILADALVAPD